MKQRRGASCGSALAMTSALLACGNVDPGDAVGLGQQALCAGEREGTREFYVPPMRQETREQLRQLKRDGQRAEAKALEKMATTARAVWLVQGAPKEVKRQAKAETKRARRAGQTPVFVAYDLPFRDCSQFSAGGATTAKEYEAWIDAVVSGIGKGPAVIVLEPDSLGIIPWFPNEWSGEYEWCQPEEGAPEGAAEERFDLLNYAVERFGALPGVDVYLDGTHSAWLGVGESAGRLARAGVRDARGFFLNASNFRATSELVAYGRWVSACLALDAAIEWWDPLWCPGQYAEVEPSVFAPDFSPEHVAAVDAAYAELLTLHTPEPIVPSAAFVIDTSRNGQGPWTPSPDHPPGDPQEWCNPPGRGLGARPTADTGVPLLDALLWIKAPGESDGECHRWDPPGSVDPVRGIVNPAAGDWFPEQALELARLSNPAL